MPSTQDRKDDRVQWGKSKRGIEGKGQRKEDRRVRGKRTRSGKKKNSALGETPNFAIRTAEQRNKKTREIENGERGE